MREKYILFNALIFTLAYVNAQDWLSVGKLNEIEAGRLEARDEKIAALQQVRIAFNEVLNVASNSKNEINTEALYARAAFLADWIAELANDRSDTGILNQTKSLFPNRPSLLPPLLNSLLDQHDIRWKVRYGIETNNEVKRLGYIQNGWMIASLDAPVPEIEPIPKTDAPINYKRWMPLMWKDPLGSIPILGAGTSYFLGAVFSDTSTAAAIRMGSSCPTAVFFNQTLIYQNDAYRTSVPDQDVISCSLVKGWNVILLRMIAEDAGSVYLRFTTLDGVPLQVNSVPLTDEVMYEMIQNHPNPIDIESPLPHHGMVAALLALASESIDSPEACYYAGSLLLKMNPFGNVNLRARQLLLRAKKLSPLRSDYGLKLAKALNMQGDHDLFRQLLEQLRQDELSVVARAVLARESLARYPERAERLALDALAENPLSADAMLVIEDVYRKRGWIQQADSMLDEILMRSPWVLDSWKRKGELSLLMGRVEHAAYCFKKALSLNFTDVESYRGLCESYWRLGKASEAAKFMEAGSRFQPYNKELWNLWIKSLQRNGDLKTAIALSEQVLKVWNSYEDAERLAELLRLDERDDEAKLVEREYNLDYRDSVYIPEFDLDKIKEDAKEFYPNEKIVLISEVCSERVESGGLSVRRTWQLWRIGDNASNIPASEGVFCVTLYRGQRMIDVPVKNGSSARFLYQAGDFVLTESYVKNPPAWGVYYETIYSFSRSYPVFQSEFRLKTYPTLYASKTDDSIVQESDEQIRIWRANNISPEQMDKKILRIGSFPDTSGLFHAYLRLFTSSLASTPELRQQARLLVANAHDDSERITILKKWLSLAIRDEADQRKLPRPVREVLIQKFGNDVDRTALLIALLRDVGIDGNVVCLMPSILTNDIPLISDVERFAIRAGEFTIDVSEPLVPLGGISFRLAGKRGFILSQSAQASITLPPLLPHGEEVREQYVGIYRGEETIEWEWTLIAQGDAAVSIRKLLLEQKNIEKGFSQLVRNEWKNVVYTELMNYHEDNTAVYLSGQVITKVPASEVFIPNNSWLQDNVAFNLAAYANSNIEKQIELPTPFRYTKQVRLSLLESQISQRLPKPIELKRQFGEFKYHAITVGKTVNVETFLEITRKTVREEEYFDFQKFARTVTQHLTFPVLIK